ncbi:MAG TPA: hypothetical protein VFQ35_12580, partial [Polyangiaceae bacterium]|nr:hypothetical protein [Polyangiaceae bacterium]
FFSIQSGVRFVVALVPPLVFVGAWLSDSSRRLNFRRYIGFFALVALAWLALDLPELLSTVVVKARNAGW